MNKLYLTFLKMMRKIWSSLFVCFCRCLWKGGLGMRGCVCLWMCLLVKLCFNKGFIMQWNKLHHCLIQLKDECSCPRRREAHHFLSVIVSGEVVISIYSVPNEHALGFSLLHSIYSMLQQNTGPRSMVLMKIQIHWMLSSLLPAERHQGLLLLFTNTLEPDLK